MTEQQRKDLDAAIERLIAEADEVDPTHAHREQIGKTALTRRKPARRPKEC